MRVEFMHKILNISHSQIDNYILVICTFSLFDRQFVKLKAFFFYACFKYMFFKILEISKLAIIDLYQLNSQLLTAFLQPQGIFRKKEPAGIFRRKEPMGIFFYSQIFFQYSVQFSSVCLYFISDDRISPIATQS